MSDLFDGSILNHLIPLQKVKVTPENRTRPRVIAGRNSRISASLRDSFPLCSMYTNKVQRFTSPKTTSIMDIYLIFI
jgi:hypothetical protein